MHSQATIEKCKRMRKNGFTLGEIVDRTGLPKTTIYDHIQGIPLCFKLQEKLERIKGENSRALLEFNIKERKGWRRKVVSRVKGWSPELICLVAHFMFDGEIRNKNGCVYNNRNIALINRVENFMKEIFSLDPIAAFCPESGVHRISYFYVQLADYIEKKSQELKTYIKTASLEEKRIFLQAFFDDEGCAHLWKKSRKVRGYQNDLNILELVQWLLKEFDIESRVDKKYKEIIISRKKNLIKFQKEINFSKGVYINPSRKNSIWKEKLEKREILAKMINSYEQ